MYPKISLLLIVLGVFLTGSARAECPPGDFDDNCKVDLEDMRIFSEQWLDEESIQADIDGLAGINLLDYAVVAKDWLQKGTHLLINEFMASNNSFKIDLDNLSEAPDWIEIYNAGDEAIDMSGMYITDNLGNPTQWRIPDGVVLDANDYLIVLADLLDYQISMLHTNFKLGAGGEQIGLFHPDGITLVDAIDFEQIEQYTDISYGLDANGVLRFFGVPTPGAENNDAYLGLVADTTFSRDRGFYDAAFDAEIECETPGAEIYYTVDFNKPDEVTGTEYTVPINITETTCLRAMAFKPGWKPTNIDTHTYIFRDNVAVQDTAQAVSRGFPDPWVHQYYKTSFIDYGTISPADYEVESTLNGPVLEFKDQLLAIPTMSIVTEMDDMFDSEIGFYVNSWFEGVAWERAASVEYFDAAGNEEFQINCGIRAQGNQNRRPYQTQKHSMRIRFKNDYGPTKLRYPIFKDSPVDTFDSLTLRGGCGDSWHQYSASRSSYTRDAWGHKTMHDMGLVAPYFNFVHLYLNGLYWGLYNPLERPDAPFYAKHMGGNEEDWEANNAGEPIAEDTPADLVVWNTVLSLVPLGVVTLSDAQYDDLSEWLDMTAFVDYLLVYFYGGAGDWGSYNFYAAALQGPPGQPPLIKLRFSTWDFEETLGLWWDPTVDITGPNFNERPDVNIVRIWKRLMENNKFRILFADRAHKWLFNDGVLTAQKCIDRWEELAAIIQDAIIGESARWGDNDSANGTQSLWEYWINEVSVNWMGPRTNTLLGQLRNRNLYPDIDAPVFNINGSYKHGGYVSEGSSLTMTNPNGTGTIYYSVDGNDPFIYEASGVTPVETTILVESASKKVLVPSGTIAGWNTLGFNDTGWNHGLPIIPGRTGGVGYDYGTGSNYDPYSTYDVETEMYGVNTSCYIRVAFNLTEDPADYDGLKLRIRYDDGFVAYINGVEAARDGFSGTPLWNSYCSWRQDTTSFAEFNITGSIANMVQGQNVLALQGINCEVGSSDFLCSVELVASTGGGGGGTGHISDSAIEYTGAITLSESTHVMARVMITAGEIEEWSALNEASYAIGPIADNLRITEMMYHPAEAPLGDPNAEFIEVKNVGGTALKLNLVKFSNGVDFTFPSMTLGAGAYAIVVKDAAVFAAQYPTFSGVIAGEYVGSLDNAGERVRLEDAVGGTVLEFRYRDDWRPITDGVGFSLTVMDEAETDPNMWDDKQGWDASTYIGGTPGEFDDGPRTGDIVINEVLAHSNYPPNDWIELHNTTASPIDITGWFLSDTDANLLKYEIPSTTIPANGS